MTLERLAARIEAKTEEARRADRASVALTPAEWRQARAVLRRAKSDPRLPPDDRAAAARLLDRWFSDDVGEPAHKEVNDGN